MVNGRSAISPRLTLSPIVAVATRLTISISSCKHYSTNSFLISSELTDEDSRCPQFLSIADDWFCPIVNFNHIAETFIVNKWTKQISKRYSMAWVSIFEMW